MGKSVPRVIVLASQDSATIVKHRVRTAGLEHQGQNSISDPDKNFGFTCSFSSGMQEICSVTQVILPRAHVFLLNIGFIGCHVISSLSDVTKMTK